MDISQAARELGKLGYKKLIENNGNNKVEYMTRLSRKAAEKRTLKAKERKNGLNSGLDNGRSV